jgi:hypothetical protein
MASVANRGLDHLRDQSLRVTHQQQVSLAVAMKLFLELPTDQPVGVAAALLDRPARGASRRLCGGTWEEEGMECVRVANHIDTTREV